jgi:hypothetical protein
MTTLSLNTATVIIEPVRRISRPGFFRRLLDAMIASRQRKAEIEVRRIQAMLNRSRRVRETADEAHALLPFRGE